MVDGGLIIFKHYFSINTLMIIINIKQKAFYVFPETFVERSLIVKFWCAIKILPMTQCEFGLRFCLQAVEILT